MDNYDDIINLPHHVSAKHPRLSIEQRAAQFAPFAALTGYGDAIRETGRITEDRIELNEEEIIKIDNKIQELKSRIREFPKITVTFFIPDSKKSGGEYVTIIGKLKKIDEYNKMLVLEDKKKIPIKDVIEIL